MKVIIRAAVMLLTVASPHTPPAVAPPGQPVYTAASMPLNEYSRAWFTWTVYHSDPDKVKRMASDGLHLDIKLPSLIIYDPGGKVAYYGITSKDNIQALAQFPHMPAGAAIPDGVVQRDALLSIVPAFARDKDLIQHSSDYLVFSLITPNNKPSSNQTDSLKSLHMRTTAPKVNIIELSVSTK